ncbi:hypothetical protein MUK42_07573 [Musa troglodytarum]|uniref:Uncharacterized protein n=1 Tax=Musa troglodytarum TaxID=320322 RepID=A0A9E7HN21_9LILI|nr:hypothetical protein MUK42_07573 [Musa troglodytarum]
MMDANSIDFLINHFLPLYDDLLLKRMDWLFVGRRGDVTVSDEVHEWGGGEVEAAVDEVTAERVRFGQVECCGRRIPAKNTNGGGDWSFD